MYVDWKIKRYEKQARREHNRMSSTLYLEEKNIPYESYNKGGHLIIPHKGGFVDFWPSTGNWVFRGTEERSRGVKELVRWMKR